MGDLRGSIRVAEYDQGIISCNPTSGGSREHWAHRPEISIKIVRVVIVCLVSLFVTVIIIRSISSINVSALRCCASNFVPFCCQLDCYRGPIIALVIVKMFAVVEIGLFCRA